MQPNFISTDWIGIRNSLLAGMGQRQPAQGAVGLVLGGGGTARAACYALKQMGVQRLWIYNRTAEKARALAGVWAYGYQGALDLDVTHFFKQPQETLNQSTFLTIRLPYSGEFGGEAVADLNQAPSDITLVVSTVPANAGLTLPAGILRPEVCGHGNE